MSLQKDQVRRLQELSVHIEGSKIFFDPDLPSSSDSTCVPHQALITSSSRNPSREIGKLRNTRQDMSIPRHVFDCQHARRDPDELDNDSRNLATKRRTIAVNTSILFFGKSKTKVQTVENVLCL